LRGMIAAAERQLGRRFTRDELPATPAGLQEL
jgi:hypothetical protein